MPIGPQLPSPVGKRKRLNKDDGSDSDNDGGVGLQLPPSAATEKDVARTDTKKLRVLGPSLPPTTSSQMAQVAHVAEPADSESSGDDDEFGPPLPATKGAQGSHSVIAISSHISKSSSTASHPKQNTRDEWMTLAPSSGDWSQRIDPTKLKNRKFGTGANSKPSRSGADAWHETPEQKQARLQREVLGVKDEQGPKPKSKLAIASQKDIDTARRMEEYKKKRGPSLYSAHQKGQKTEEEDDPSARAFDREKDIGGGLQLNATQRRDMVKKSSDFNSRFSSAKYL